VSGSGTRPERPSVLLFDWDNTLVDGWVGITAALNATFTAFDKPGQPIYPGYLVRALYSRSGSTGFTMFVTSVTWNHTKGQVPTVNVTARIIPEGWSPVG